MLSPHILRCATTRSARFPYSTAVTIMSTTSSPSPAGNSGGDSTPSLLTTASAIVAHAVSGSHVLRIDAYSRTKGLGNGKRIASEKFAVGGHRWCIDYYPDGIGSDDADWLSIYLTLRHIDDANEVKAQFVISLLDKHGKPVPSYCKSSEIRIFSSKQASWSWGFRKFIKRKDLEESSYLQDNVFSVRCDVTVAKEIITEPIPPAVVVPLSDMHHHLGNLLSAGEGADVTSEVGGETFAAHRCILAARSSVFSAELLGPMKKKTGAPRIRIDDMEPKVFRALLHFIYTDSLPPPPEMDVDGDGDGDGDTAVVAMAQHLLVAADRYDMERLKLICEEKLCDGNNICSRTAATTLALAEQHGCGALKKACFKFLTSPGNLKAAMASDGFAHLKSSCPSVLEELVAKLAL